MMKTAIASSVTLLVLLSTSSLLRAQLPEWQWASRAGGPDWEIGRSIQTDASGNVYMAGSFYSPTVTFGEYTLSSAATSSLFLVKFDPLGNVLWATSSQGTGTVDVNSMAIDSDGNILIGGKFSSLLLVLGNTTLSGVGSDDAYLVKFDPDGIVVWAKSAGTSSIERFLGVACDAEGNTYTTGTYSGASITFETITLNNVENNNVTSFLVKYNEEGSVVWAVSIGGDEADWGRAVAVDSNGDVVVAGEHGSSVISFGSISLINEGGTVVFIAKFDSSGNAIWANSGNASNSTCQSVAVDVDNNIYITGSYSGEEIAFDEIVLANSGQSGYSDFFLAKLNSEGIFEWGRSSTGDEQEEGRAVSIDSSENVCVAGFFISPNTSFESTTFQSAGLEDSFVATYTPEGEMIWAFAVGGAQTDYIHAMTCDNFGNVYVTGFFESSALAFGEHEVYTSNSSWDAFVAKLGETSNGLGEISGNAFQAYPNPFSDRCVIQLPGPISNGSVVVENSLGQRVAEVYNMSGSRMSFYRNNLEPGIYFVRVSENEKIVAQGRVLVID